jgi:hypothetical protein
MIAAKPEEIVSDAKLLLAQSREAVASKLAVSDDFVQEGQWVHVVVYPKTGGVDALDYLDELETIENELRKKFGDEILVVPVRVRD